MPVVLLCWEGGGGQGHVVRLRRIAQALRKRGAICIAAAFKFDEREGLKPYLDGVIQAPGERWGNETPPKLQLSPDPRDACNTTLSLWEMGFWRTETIAANLRGWDDIFAHIKPDAVVADLAPFALLAAAGRIPTFAVGHGFFVPAVLDGYFTPDDQPPSLQDRAAQDKFFDNILVGFAKASIKPPRHLGEALCSDTPCPATLPALDPRYRLRPNRLAPPEMDATPRLRLAHGNEILIYLGADPASHQSAIDAVGRTGLAATLYATPESAAKVIAPPTLTIQHEPFTPKHLAARANLIVHHGGVGITHMAALAGAPQLAAYRGHERWHNAKALSRQGVGGGRAIDGGDMGEFSQLIANFARPGSHRDAAAIWAYEANRWIAGRRGQDVIADRILGIMRFTNVPVKS